MNKKTRLILSVSLFVIFGIILLFFIIRFEKNFNIINKNSPTKEIWTADFFNSSDNKNIDVSVLQTELIQTGKKFTNHVFGFSFSYPKDYTATSFIDSNTGAYVTLIQNPEQGIGFQIQISQFTEQTNYLSVERIKKDLPDLEMSGIQEIELGQYGKGVVFFSNNKSFKGGSREIWFVWKGYLYQISTYKYLDSILQAIMNTWEFK